MRCLVLFAVTIVLLTTMLLLGEQEANAGPYLLGRAWRAEVTVCAVNCATTSSEYFPTKFACAAAMNQRVAAVHARHPALRISYVCEPDERTYVL